MSQCFCGNSENIKLLSSQSYILEEKFESIDPYGNKFEGTVSTICPRNKYLCLNCGQVYEAVNLPR